MGDWSELLPELLVVIARKIELVEDFLTFKGVCTSWRAAATKDNFVKPSWPTVPLFMLAEEKGCDYREFYSLSKGKICRRLSLPEAKNKKCMETRGWFVTVHGPSGEMNLLHPFSRVQIELPNQRTFPDYEGYEPGNLHRFVERVLLSASPSDTSDYVLVAVHCVSFFLAFWRPGDKYWTRIESYDGVLPSHKSFYDVNYYNGKLYAIDLGGHIWVLDISDPMKASAQSLFCIGQKIIGGRNAYLVELAGELLVVARNGTGVDNDEETYGATDFRVIQLDLNKSTWKEITSLGDMTIFVGHNSAFSLDATKFPDIIKPNCIYFTDDSIEAYYWTISQTGGGRDMGIYNLEDGKMERFDNVQSFSLICPPVWVAPSV